MRRCEQPSLYYEWAKADAFCKKHYGSDVRDLGWENYIEAAIGNGEDVEQVCRELAEDYDLADITTSPWGTI